MAKYARIQGDTALETFEPPEGKAIAECFHPHLAAQFEEVPAQVERGWVRTEGVWAEPAPVEPPVPDPVVPVRHVTKLAFRNRFTQAEKVTLEIAALDNPAATMPERQQAAGLRAALKDQENATYIDLERAETRAGVINLETFGILAAGRALEILDAQIQPYEVYRG